MELRELGNVELTYRSLESVDYGVGGQVYGTMEGTLRGSRIGGSLHLTNLAQRRPDGANLPTLRGLLTTDDGAQVYVELDGIALLRQEDQARVFVTACRFRTGSERHAWLNTVMGVLEGVLDTVAVHGTARGRMYECRPTMA